MMAILEHPCCRSYAAGLGFVTLDFLVGGVFAAEEGSVQGERARPLRALVDAPRPLS